MTNKKGERFILTGKFYNLQKLKIKCCRCGKRAPMQFRRMKNGDIRNQPRCSACRQF